jgi:mRNA-degrading endonuclease RelE of RelBE toxin-antitoxin system
MWSVRITRSAQKQVDRLSDDVRLRFDLLARELAEAGPLRANWRNFGRLKGTGRSGIYHCHIKSGRPTYVACWATLGKEIQFIEVYYVGTHEKAPY